LFFQHPYEVEGIETKSVAESDSGKLLGDVLSGTAVLGKAESDYNEPSLANIIITHYEGGKSKRGQFEGYGEAQFVGGNSYKVSFEKRRQIHIILVKQWKLKQTFLFTPLS